MRNFPDVISHAILDWTDPELLRELLRRRLVANNLDSKTTFDEIWPKICVTHVDGEESASYLIDRCLMRPRSLIELIYHCRSHAVNLNHARVLLDDIREGEKSFSNELVENIDLEIRDVFPDLAPDIKNVLYEFLGSTPRLSEQEVQHALARYGVADALRAQLIELLLWWGFFGGVSRPLHEAARTA